MSNIVESKKLINISELAKRIGLINKKNGMPSVHTIRFWETKFYQIKPVILSGNRRYYSKSAVELVTLIKYMLKEQGLTIAGVQKVLKKKIMTLDEYQSSSITAEYFKNKIKFKSRLLLNKIKKLKK